MLPQARRARRPAKTFPWRVAEGVFTDACRVMRRVTTLDSRTRYEFHCGIDGQVLNFTSSVQAERAAAQLNAASAR